MYRVTGGSIGIVNITSNCLHWKLKWRTESFKETRKKKGISFDKEIVCRHWKVSNRVNTIPSMWMSIHIHENGDAVLRIFVRSFSRWKPFCLKLFFGRPHISALPSAAIYLSSIRYCLLPLVTLPTPVRAQLLGNIPSCFCKCMSCSYGI